MSWNYRVVQREDLFAIHEVYYDEAGKPAAVTADAMTPDGDTLEELRETFEQFREAFDQPVLQYEDFSLSLEGTCEDND